MRFHIEMLTCGGCPRSANEAVETVDPMARVNADPVTMKVAIESALPCDAFSRALDDAGYPGGRCLT